MTPSSNIMSGEKIIVWEIKKNCWCLTSSVYLLQEEYQSEGIAWHNIDYTDNVACIHLVGKKPTGLFYLLDEESK